MRHPVLYVLLLLCFSAGAQVSNFSININGSPPPGFTTALNVAAQKWNQHLDIKVPVKINVYAFNVGQAPFSGLTLSNGRKNFVNAPFSNFLYPTALANQLAMQETNPGEYDMDIYFNLATPLYFGTGQPASWQMDFITLAMHEIGHGLGFYSDGYVDQSGIGSFGNVPSSVIFPLATSFPWRGQDSLPTIFDRYIVKTSGNPLVTLAPANSQALGDSIKNGAVYFSGPLFANASYSGAPIRLSGGTGTFEFGADLLHVHNTYAGTIMSYHWGPGDTVRAPAPWELGILKELGWKLNLTGMPDEALTWLNCFPNPADEALFIYGEGIRRAGLSSLFGEPAREAFVYHEQGLLISTAGLPEGVYLLKVAYEDARLPDTVRKIVVSH